MSPGIPSRIAEAKRDLGAMASALGVVGGGGSPSEMRSDGGIFIGMGVEETLKRHIDLMNVDVENIVTVASGAGVTNTTIFSFPEDHYILAIAFSTSNIARQTYQVLSVQPQGQSEEILIAHTLLADGLAFDGATAFVVAQSLVQMDGGVNFPLFGKAATDYAHTVRAEVGQMTGTLSVYRVRAPKGVEIAH